MKQRFNSDKLGDEALKIIDPITTEDFFHYFKKKREKTETSPSGRHMGHYKAILRNEGLVRLHLLMINIPLQCGFTSVRWKNSISIMMDKDKVSPKIDQLA